jgi:Crinkler effector protein N-terminal domain
MPYELFCGLTKNDDHPFVVNVEESLTVTGLKQAIQTANQELADFAYHKLTLYRIDEGLEKKLDPYYELSKIFEDAGPHKGKMHILVELPESESIDPRACDIAEIGKRSRFRAKTPTIAICFGRYHSGTTSGCGRPSWPFQATQSRFVEHDCKEIWVWC